jgi:hypothetical protein
MEGERVVEERGEISLPIDQLGVTESIVVLITVGGRLRGKGVSTAFS